MPSVFTALLLLFIAGPLAAQKQPTGGAAPLGATKSATARRAVPAAAETPGARAPLADDQTCAPEPANRSVCYANIDVRYDVLQSGDVTVTETFTVRFNGDWNGIELGMTERATSHDFRSDDERSSDPDSSFRDIEIDRFSAADERGNALRLESEDVGDEVVIRVWVPGARDTLATVVLTYRIEDGITFLGDTDEFYWNVWSAASSAHVARFRVTLIPPESVTGLRVRALAGDENTRQSAATAAVENGSAVFATTAPVRIGQNFTIVAGWDGGVVDRPGPLARFGDWLARWWAVVLPVLSLAFMWSRWSRRGRDPAMLPIVTQYEPPQNVTPGEVGTLLDERADMRDVTATLVDLAVNGHLRIDETEGTKVLGMEFGESYRFVQTTPDPAARVRPLSAHESKLLDALFSGRSQVELDDLKNSFYKNLPGIRESMMDSLVSQGVYTKRPDRARAAWVVGGIMSGVALFFLLGAIGRTHPVALVLVPPLVALPILIFGWLMPRRTDAGTRLIGKLRGFREFLERVDGDRLRRMNIEPNAFEKLLPFAMALGVEKKWAEAFDGLAQEPPRWYHTRNGRAFRPSVFASDLGRMSTATASNMASSPKSSGGGGSGFGGGGRVGGGGGGTRGGGF